MKDHKLLSALEHVDPELIEEAMTPPTTPKKNWKPMIRGLVAACICIVCMVLLMRGLSDMGMKVTEPEEPKDTTGATEEYIETEVPGDMLTTAVGEEIPPAGYAPGIDAFYFRVMLFTPYGRIEDEAYKETTFAAVLQWCEASEGEYAYEQLWEDSITDSMTAVEMAVSMGYNVLVFPGADFADVIREAAWCHPEICFVALHMTEDELQQTGESSYICPPNIYCVE